jgi:hypothetical protein
MAAQVGGLNTVLHCIVDDTLNKHVPVVVVCKTNVTLMSIFQQAISSMVDDFDEDGGSMIEPHKQCATLVFNRHINVDQARDLLDGAHLGTVVPSVKSILCHMLVGREHPLAIIIDGTGLELTHIVQDCSRLQAPYKSINTTVMGSYIMEFWMMEHLDTYLLKWYVYDLKKNPHHKMISIYGRADQNCWIGGLTELPNTLISKILQKAHHVHCSVCVICNLNNKCFKGCTHVLCDSLEDGVCLDKKKNKISFDGINLCKVDVINKKRSNAPPKEQPIPYSISVMNPVPTGIKDSWEEKTQPPQTLLKIVTLNINGT